MYISSCLIVFRFQRYEMAVMKLLFLACVWIGSTAGHEFFSSMDQVMQLVEEEKNLLKLFSSYISAEEESLNTLKSDLQTLELSVNSEDPERAMNDPVAVYKLIRRLRIKWLSILQSTPISLQSDFQEWLQSDLPKFPSEEDLEAAAFGLIRWQEKYKLYPENIGTPLSANEAFYVGKVAYQQKNFQHAFHWFMHSLRLLYRSESLRPIQGVTRQQLLEYLGSSAYHYGSPSVTIDFNKHLLHLDQIMQFADTEINLLELFGGYIDAEEENLHFLKGNLQTLKWRINSEDPEKSMSNPTEAYKLIKRLRHDWLFILQSTRISHYKVDIQEWLHSDLPNFPSEEDLEGAALGLIRLQEIYKLYPENITRGAHFSSDEAAYVGYFAYQHEKFQHAFLWFLYSLKMLNHPKSLHPIESDTKESLLHFLGSSAHHFGSLSVAVDVYQQLLKLDPNNEEIRNKLNETNSTLQLQNRTLEPDINTLSTTHSTNSYEALCKGDTDQRTSRRQRALSCRYSTGGGNPRLILAPLKEEIEWDEPRIVRYHDIISDKEIEILKNISRPQLSRSEVLIEQEGAVSNIRVSQSVFLEDDAIVVVRVNQRIADATGLSMETAEPLHNYGIGGRYEPHHDTLDAENDRIATFLTYMSDVEIGGATVFPEIGVALKPKKGSAVFWYNLHKNGTVNSKTLHAGCPVLLGNKWVTNKWIHEFGQEFTRPCSLSEWE
ncbi:prolyl 4-hydroxylase subunit alpha-2-like isoform X2 [Triplophysa rosa]|uniref:prolyl 4-hydroxylase subunit alpha-2-like isoform X2 n=1 Tax=Triplophysa rosa TaxID=992332 RepID=UPI002546314C|nr:prolyl 4-hydroxylase subunit alpha-2-like isoform X2 [Triplophysa rosa]